MKLIVGLGNPGKDYEKTRHNIGFRVIDTLVESYSFEKVGKKFKGILYKGVMNGEPVLLLKPQTFMNLSGEAVQVCMAFYKLSLDDVIVVFDDFDISYGEVRFREKGGAGTHNGMKSVVQLLGAGSFKRIRVGIGPLPEKHDVSSFVLSPFASEEEEKIEPILKEAAKKTVLNLFNP